MRKYFIPLLLLLLFLAFVPKLASTRPLLSLIDRIVQQKTDAPIRIGTCRFSWLGPQIFHQVHWDKQGVSGVIEELAINAPFWSFSGPFELKNSSFFYLGQKVDLLNGTLVNNQLDLTGSHVALHGMLQSKTNFDLAVDIKDCPIAPQEMVTVKGIIRPANIDLDIKARLLQVHLVAALEERGIVLKAPLTADIQITKELLPNAESKTTAHLKIEAEDSFFPIPFSFEKLRAKGRIDLGQMQYTSDSPLAAVLAFLQFSLPKTETDLWFAPVDFRLQNGTLDLERLDFLVADSVHLCTWGTIDLLKDQLQMTLGIPASTLFRFFKVNNAEPSYVLKVGMRGSLQNLEIAKKSAAAKIAALLTSNRMPKRGVLGRASEAIALIKAEKNVPPAAHPLPWEK